MGAAMTDNQARQLADEYLQRLRETDELPNTTIESWRGTGAVQNHDGWYYVDYARAAEQPQDPGARPDGRQGVLIMPDGTCRLVFGALGKGWAQSRKPPHSRHRPD